MSKVKSMSMARLSPKAQEAMSEMLSALMALESDLILNTSKLVSYLLIDFKEKQFEKSKASIAYSFRNKRKHAKTRLSALTEEELEAAIKYLTKIKKVEPAKE
jgi:hypothetical protein